MKYKSITKTKLKNDYRYQTVIVPKEKENIKILPYRFAPRTSNIYIRRQTKEIEIVEKAFKDTDDSMFAGQEKLRIHARECQLALEGYETLFENIEIYKQDNELYIIDNYEKPTLH